MTAQTPATLEELLRGWEPTGAGPAVRLECDSTLRIVREGTRNALRVCRTVRIYVDTGTGQGKRAKWTQLGPVVVDDDSWATTLQSIGQVLDELARQRAS